MNAHTTADWQALEQNESPAKLIAFFADPDKAKFLHSFSDSGFDNHGALQLRLEKGNEKEALAITEVDHDYDIWLVECRHTKAEQLLRFVTDIKPRLKRDASLYLVAEVSDVELYKSLIRLGVSDVVSLSANKDEISQLINAKLRPAEDFGNSKGIAFWGARGGVGNTTLAVAVAQYISEVRRQQLLLVDVDTQLGDSSVLSNCTDKGMLLDVLDAGSRLDWLLLDRSVVKLNDKLHLLNDEADLAQQVGLNPDTLQPLSKLVAERDATHLWDLPNALPTEALDAIASTIRVCVLTAEPSLSSLRDLQKKWELINQFTHIRPVVVLNHSRNKRNSLLDAKTVTNTLGFQVDLEIDYSPAAMVKQEEQGSTLISGRGKFARQLKTLGLEALGEQPRRSNLARPCPSWFSWSAR